MKTIYDVDKTFGKVVRVIGYVNVKIPNYKLCGRPLKADDTPQHNKKDSYSWL